MSQKPVFLANTADEVIEEIQRIWPSFADQVTKIDLILTKAEKEVRKIIGKMESTLYALIDVSKMPAIRQYKSLDLIYKILVIYKESSQFQVMKEASNISPKIISYFNRIKEIKNLLLPRNEVSDLINSIEDELKVLSSTDLSEDQRAIVNRTLNHLKVKTTDEDMIFEIAALLEVDGEMDTLRTEIRQQASTINEIRDFSQELSYLTRGIRQKAELYDDTSALENALKINWLGTVEESKDLIKFLLENDYIEGINPNQYLAKHFLFNGKPKDGNAIRKNHSRGNGDITEFADHLEILVRKN